MPRVRGILAIGALCLALTACTSPIPGVPGPTGSTPPSDAAAPPQPQAGGGSSQAGGCPLDAADLSTATSLTWELRDTKVDYPLETAESLKATVCVFTAADAPQFGGDPLVLRVDTISGADAAALRTNFERTCTSNDGKLEPSTATDGAEVCRRDSSVVEGNIAGSGRTVDVYVVNADNATAKKLTPSFDDVLAAVS
jgi:hypothetical protein